MADKKYANAYKKVGGIHRLTGDTGGVKEIFPSVGIAGGASKPIQKHVFRNNKNPKKEIIIKTSSENKARKIFKEKHSGKGVHVYTGIKSGKD